MFEWILNGGATPEVVLEYVKKQRLSSADGNFGYSVSVSGDGSTLLVGAYGAGTATVYRWGG